MHALVVERRVRAVVTGVVAAHLDVAREPAGVVVQPLARTGGAHRLPLAARRDAVAAAAGGDRAHVARDVRHRPVDEVRPGLFDRNLQVVATDRFGNGRRIGVDAEQRERLRAVRYIGPCQMRVAVGREPVRLPHRELRRDRTGILETLAPKAHVRLLSSGKDQASGYPRRTATGASVANGPASACAYWRQ